MREPFDTRRLLAACAGSLALLALVAGCGTSGTSPSSGSSSTESSGNGQPAHVAFLVNTLASYETSQYNGIKKKVEPAGGSATILNAGFEQQKQLQQCEDAVESGRYNVIILNAVSGSGSTPCVIAAANAGIPVISMEIPLGKDPNKVGPQMPGVVQALTVPTDVAGEGVAKLTSGACGKQNPCKVIFEVASASDVLTNGFAKKVEELPNVEVVAKIAAEYNPATLQTELSSVLTANPDSNVLVTEADFQALAAVPVLKASGLEGKVKLIGAGGSREGKAAIEEGTMFGTSATYPRSWGELAGEGANQAANGEEISKPAIDLIKVSPLSVVTPANVSEFEPQWGANK